MSAVRQTDRALSPIQLADVVAPRSWNDPTLFGRLKQQYCHVLQLHEHFDDGWSVRLWHGAAQACPLDIGVTALGEPGDWFCTHISCLSDACTLVSDTQQQLIAAGVSFVTVFQPTSEWLISRRAPRRIALYPRGAA